MRLANCQAGRQAVCHERNKKSYENQTENSFSKRVVSFDTRDEIGSLDHSSLFM